MIDNLYTEYRESEISCEQLCGVFHMYLKMYMMLRQDSFTDVDLEKLEVIITHSLVY